MFFSPKSGIKRGLRTIIATTFFYSLKKLRQVCGNFRKFGVAFSFCFQARTLCLVY